MAGAETRHGVLAWIALLSRLVLGGAFLALGYAKLGEDPVAFLKVIREYELFAPGQFAWMNLIAATLPGAELWLGALLVLGIWRRGAALVALAMLVPFTVAIYARALTIGERTGEELCAIAFDCGCGTGVVNVCAKLFENGGLIALALLLVAVPRSALALRDRWRSA
jgi:uncharacterized membrane protein YphA (DoxX/SURF4 family)